MKRSGGRYPAGFPTESPASNSKVFCLPDGTKKVMKPYLFLLLVLAVLITAGCVEEYTPAANVTTAATAVTTAAPANTPAGTPTPAPEQMAYLSGIQCGVGDRSEAAYHCNGDIRIRGGSYEKVQVLARYPDNNTFKSGAASMGGEDAVSKPFVVFPDIKYQGQTPVYFVKMDGIIYPVTWSGTMGVAWSNTPVAEGVDVP
jgi:hypothetical protein